MTATTRKLISRVARLSMNAAPGVATLTTATATATATACRASTSRLPGSSSPYGNVRFLATTSFGPSSYALGNLQPLQPPKKRKRVGRGSSSGRGGTSTRGHKGQRARSGNGKPTPGFEGGQTPLMRRYPKRGFTNSFAKEYAPVNLEKIQEWIDQGRLDPTKPITARELYQSRCIHSYAEGVKALARNSSALHQPIHLIVSRASQTAIEQIERQGGSIICKYYTPNTLRALVKPEKYVGRLTPRDAIPVSKKALIWYSNAANRGYLANLTPEVRPPSNKEARQAGERVNA